MDGEESAMHFINMEKERLLKKYNCKNLDEVLEHLKAKREEKQ